MEKLLALLEQEAGEAVEPDTPLLSSGIIDSLKFVRLLALFEQHFGRKINPSQVGTDNFDTPDQMLRFIETGR
jgi:acyl carrier protein